MALASTTGSALGPNMQIYFAFASMLVVALVVLQILAYPLSVAEALTAVEKTCDSGDGYQAVVDHDSSDLDDIVAEDDLDDDDLEARPKRAADPGSPRRKTGKQSAFYTRTILSTMSLLSRLGGRRAYFRGISINLVVMFLAAGLDFTKPLAHLLHVRIPGDQKSGWGAAFTLLALFSAVVVTPLLLPLEILRIKAMVGVSSGRYWFQELWIAARNWRSTVAACGVMLHVSVLTRMSSIIFYAIAHSWLALLMRKLELNYTPWRLAQIPMLLLFSVAYICLFVIPLRVAYLRAAVASAYVLDSAGFTPIVPVDPHYPGVWNTVRGVVLEEREAKRPWCGRFVRVMVISALQYLFAILVAVVLGVALAQIIAG